MCAHTVAVVTGLVLALGSIWPGPAHAQTDTAQPAVQELSSKPIGKVVSPRGSVTIEHASAVVVQANLGSQAGRAKVGDLVYQGDVGQTAADGRLGINYGWSSFNLRAMPAWP